MTARAGRIAALMLVPLALAGCETPAPAANPGSGPVPLGDYQLLTMGGQDVEADHVTMFLAADSVTGGGFCNRYNGRQSAILPALQITAIGSTLMACPGDRMQKDGTYFRALEAAIMASFADGLLTISGGGPALVYEPHVPDSRD